MARETKTEHGLRGFTYFFDFCTVQPRGGHANALDYHAHRGVLQEHTSRSPPPGTAARASLAYFSTKLERTQPRGYRAL